MLAGPTVQLLGSVGAGGGRDGEKGEGDGGCSATSVARVVEAGREVEGFARAPDERILPDLTAVLTVVGAAMVAIVMLAHIPVDCGCLLVSVQRWDKQAGNGQTAAAGDSMTVQL